MPKAPNAPEEDVRFDPDQDRYPTFVQAIRRILQEADIPDDLVDHLEVFVHASGELTYRYRIPRGEVYEGGYLGPA